MWFVFLLLFLLLKWSKAGRNILILFCRYLNTHPLLCSVIGVEPCFWGKGVKAEMDLLGTHMHTGHCDEEEDADASAPRSQRNRTLRPIAVGSLEVRKPENETALPLMAT